MGGLQRHAHVPGCDGRGQPSGRLRDARARLCGRRGGGRVDPSSSCQRPARSGRGGNPIRGGRLAMHLYDIPLVFALVGVVLYTVLAGADFGSGIWQLTAGGGSEADRIRDHAHESVAPVWEANHVWLIFILVVMWTSYPVAFSSIASTLCVPLLIAGIGIIFRGATYALRSGTRSNREVRAIDTVFAFSSILAPF